MLDVAIVNRIRENVQANLDPRDQTLAKAINRVAGQLSARGVAQSSRAVFQYIDEGQAEFSARANYIFQTITRSHGSMSGQITATLKQDLANELSHLLNVHADQVAEVVMGRMNGYIGGHKDQVRTAMRTYREEKRRQLESEIDFYLDSLKARTSQREPGGASVTIHGNVGAVQTGPGAVANVVLNQGDRDRLAQALDDLRADLERALDTPLDLRTDALDLIADAKRAVQGERPSGSRIYGLLSGLGQAVQTLGASVPAWEVVKTTAASMGLLLG